MICLLVMTDGRDELLFKTIESATTHLRGVISRYILHTDAGADHVNFLHATFPGWEVIGGNVRLGFGGAINRAWNYITESGPEEYVFHLEDDFLFNRNVFLHDIRDVMNDHPYLAQMALRRQPWNDAERAAGGIVEMWPKEYEDKTFLGNDWLEHRLFYTTNPSLVRRAVIEDGWPQVDRSEEAFSKRLFSDPEARCGFWGARNSGEWVNHIGTDRVGSGY